MHAHRRTFLTFSAEVTGYSPTDLEGTGLVDEYHALLEAQAGKRGMQLFRGAATRVMDRKESERAEAMHLDVITSDDFVDDIVRAVIDHTRTGEYGDGRVLIMPIEEAYSIRTRQCGAA